VLGTLGHLAGHDVHVHVGVSKGSLWNHGGYSHKGWYDVTKMHGNSDGAPKSIKKSASSGIQSLIKKQVGSGFFKFMSKLANKFGDNGGAAGSYGNPAGDGVSRWRKYVVKALKANGFSASPSQISAWMRVISRESKGDPKAINNWDSNAKAGHPSKGLVQTIGPTFAAYKFKGHNQIYNGFDDLLAGINYMKHIYGKGPSAFARVSGPEGYAKGGHMNRNKLSIVGEKGWELFKPDTAGTVIPHEASEKIINGQNKKVSIDARTNLTIQGHADSSTINRIDERIEKRNNDLVEKMRQLLGSNDEGGLTV
ncbi:transglycosylase SLT domain-containing protein, partial [Lentilactobacillus sp. G22-6]|uniref:lytic transglycosylase domain-containing protein n=1 Tax=Lentilactobacillus dabitei TaxID=2831523 RepID=UPI001C2528FD